MPDRSFTTFLRYVRRHLDTDGPEQTADSQLVGRFAALHDEAAFEMLLQRHGPMVLNLCRSVLRDEHDAEDAFQATFLVLACKARSIRKRQSVASWLHGVALRVARRARSRVDRRRRQEVPVLDEPAAPATGDVELRELRWLLANELQQLPEKYRAPLVLCYLEGKTNQAAARELGWPSGSMGKRLARGRELLRERLMARGVAVPAGLLALLTAATASAAVPASLFDSTLRAVTLFSAGAAAPAAPSVALAQGVLRAMIATRLKVLVPVLLFVAFAVGGAGQLAYQSRAAGGAEEGPAVLPTDPRAEVLLYDIRRTDLPRQTEGARLCLTADGTVTAHDPYGSGGSATARLSAGELQGLLRFVLREHRFNALDRGSLEGPGRSGAATVSLEVQADGRKHALRCPDPAHLDPHVPEAGHLRAISERLEKLAGWAYAGGHEGVSAALEHVNRQVSRDFPEAPRLSADDFQLARPCADGNTEVVFERRGVAPDGNPYSFVYARLEVPKEGKPQVTVKASLTPTAPKADSPRKPRTAPRDVHPRAIADDPTVKYDYDIVYVRVPRDPSGKYLNKQTRAGVWSADVTFFDRMPAGGDLMLLHPDGHEEVLVRAGDGCVADPCVSFDGEWVYYAYFHDMKNVIGPGSGNHAPHAGADICKIHVKSRKIVQLTQQVYTPNTGATDWSKDYRTRETGKSHLPFGVLNTGPCPLPGGKVMFTSNRNGFRSVKKERSAMQLFVMDDDGGNVEEVGHLNLAGALHPVILADGRVMFSSFENQGARRTVGTSWAIWTIHPDGTNWAPLLSGYFMSLHFQGQLSDGSVVVNNYYAGKNQGMGTLMKLPAQAPSGYPPFGPAFRRDPRNQSNVPGEAQGFRTFTPYGLESLTLFADGSDNAGWPNTIGTRINDPSAPRMGHCTHPAGAPDNHLLAVWSPGAAHPSFLPAIDSGLYLIKGGKPIDEPGQMLLIKNDPNYNEQWPRALVPYKRIYGVEEPARLPALVNNGKRCPHLPEGTPFGLVGTSSLYKRESYPDGAVPTGKVTAQYAGGKDLFQGLGGYFPPGRDSLNWVSQGADAGLYGNSDIWGIRILIEEPTTHPTAVPIRYHNIAEERLRILGEFPVRKFKGAVQPVDPDGNPDTSFLAKIPTNVAWTFQALDNNGMVLNMAQTWHQLRPGEIRNDCGGCHAHSQKPTDFKLTAAAKPEYQPWDLTRRTPLFTRKAHDQSGRKWDAHDQTGVRYQNGIKNVEYFRDVKPIFERSCAACHTNKDARSASAPGEEPRRTGKPLVDLVLDRNQPVRDGQVPETYHRLVHWFSPDGGGPSTSYYVWKFQARRSLLIWKIHGRRLDGWKNEDVPPPSKEASPGAGISHRYFDGRYRGSIMPPPEAVAGTYTTPDGRKIKVAPLSDEDRLTLVRWVDLGCPIDLAFDPDHPERRAPGGWMIDEQRPTLTLTYPGAGPNPPLARLLVGMHDYDTGLDLASFHVVADFPLDGVPAGQDLASRFTALPDNRWEMKLAKPLADLPRGKLTVSVKDRQGNITRIERTFSVAASRASRPSE
jgi:RNA polymerase sigma factor (sigma-70 family)